MLDGVDVTVDEGTIFALLGPNGAGKTTIVRILTTLIAADAGDVRVAGHDLRANPDGVRAAIGVTGQFSALDDMLTGEENLQLMADLNRLGRAAGRRRVAELLERFDLVDAARRPASTYSGGMRRRLDLAMTLVGSPQVIFLDEPTTGLDPRSRRTMWDAIRELAAGGVTILLTTQYLDEADELADRIAVLDHGRIVAEGTADELKRRIPGGHVRLQFAEPDALRAAADLLDAASADEERLELQVPSDASVASLRRLLEQLDDADIEVAHLSIHTPDLDDVFFAVTGQPGRRGDPSAMTSLAYTLTDSRTMLRRNLRRLQRYPSMTLQLVGMPIVFLLLFVYVFGGQLGQGLSSDLAGGHDRPHRLPQLRHARHPADDRRRGRPGHRDRRRHGHDRRHRRPLPHDVHRPCRRPRRPRARHPDPGPGQPRDRARRRDRARLPAHRRPARVARARSACSRCSASR